MEGQILRIEDTQHIDLLSDLLDTALQFTNTRLISSVLADDILQNLLRDRHTLSEVDLLERGRENEGLSNNQLLLLIIPLQLNHNHTIQ